MTASPRPTCQFQTYFSCKLYAIDTCAPDLQRLVMTAVKIVVKLDTFLRRTKAEQAAAVALSKRLIATYGGSDE